MNTLFKASVQTLNALFNHVSSTDHTVMWMRNGKYDKQLYISPNYESVWQRSCNSIYEFPDSWSEWLVAGERENILQQTQKRKQHVSLDIRQNNLFYRIGVQDKVHYIKDWCFPITENQQLIAYIGIAEQVSPQEWHEAMKLNMPFQPSNNQVNDLKHDFMKILAREFQFYEINSCPENSLITKTEIQRIQHTIHQTAYYTLTPREIECCYYLCLGKSAKEIAKISNISFRTVEKYLGSAINKTGSNKRTDLVLKLSSYFSTIV